MDDAIPHEITLALVNLHALRQILLNYNEGCYCTPLKLAKPVRLKGFDFHHNQPIAHPISNIQVLRQPSRTFELEQEQMTYSRVIQCRWWNQPGRCWLGPGSDVCGNCDLARVKLPRDLQFRSGSVTTWDNMQRGRLIWHRSRPFTTGPLQSPGR